MNKLFMMDFPIDKIKLNVCYKDEELLQKIEQDSRGQRVLPKVQDVYNPLIFPAAPESRPYIISSIVLSSDGKMAFHDMPAGPVIAKNNFFDPDGALADFWILNALRAHCEGIILGARTLQAEALNTSHIFDNELFVQRRDILKKNNHPLNIVVSFDGTDIPLDHMIFNVEPGQGFQAVIGTSPRGGEHLQKMLSRKIEIICPFNSSGVFIDGTALSQKSDNTIPVIVTGEGDVPDTSQLLLFLKKIGIEKLLIESPTFTSQLITRGELDEFFINYSMVIAGGPITPGSLRPFSHEAHPHSKLLTVATHKSSFMYTRQKLYYGVEQLEDLSRFKY